jgi:hypothetical protein
VSITKEQIERTTEIAFLRDLKPHPRNPRVHPESLIAKLVKSIENFGWTNPVILARDGTVLAGHARLEAAKRIGLDRVPVLRTELDGDKADAYLIADNRIADDSEWDRFLLKGILLDLDHGAFDLELTGFSLGEVEELMTAVPPVGFPSLSSGEQGDYRSMTFVIHKDHQEVIEKALDRAVDGQEVSAGNKKGFALYLLCRGIQEREE